MNLYHFTSHDALCAILIHGLLPREVQGHTANCTINAWDELFNIPVVWLTTDPQASLSTVANLDRMDVRITVDLSPNSKRLVSWMKWLGKCAPEIRDRHRVAQENVPDVNTTLWYVYLGTISPERFSAVELTNQQDISIKLDNNVDPSAPEITVLKTRLQNLAIPFILPNILRTTTADQVAAR